MEEALANSARYLLEQQNWKKEKETLEQRKSGG